jgi:hypothetical protein
MEISDKVQNDPDRSIATEGTITTTQGLYVDASPAQIQQTFSDLLSHKLVQEIEVSFASGPAEVLNREDQHQLHGAVSQPDKAAYESLPSNNPSTFTDQGNKNIPQKSLTDQEADYDINRMLAPSPTDKKKSATGTQTRVDVVRSQAIRGPGTDPNAANRNLKPKDFQRGSPAGSQQAKSETTSENKSNINHSEKTLAVRKVLIFLEQRVTPTAELPNHPPAPALPE